MASTPGSPLHLCRTYGKILARKMGFVALGWLAVYFITHPMRVVPSDGGVNILTLYGPAVGAFAGLVTGWYLATDSVEDSSLQGIVLWVVLVAASVIPMWATEGMMRLITRWPLNFGGWMVLTGGNIMALAAAVWHASSQE